MRVTSVAEGQSAKEITKMLKAKINPARDDLQVSKLRETRAGNVIVDCINQEAANKLQLMLKTKAQDSLKTQELRKTRPRVILHGIEDSVDKGQLATDIFGQNKWLVDAIGGEDNLREEMCEKFRTGGRGEGAVCGVVFEVTPRVRSLLINRAVYLGWQAIWARDHFSLMQCYQCYDYGHRAHECKVKEQMCGKCGGNHKYKDCASRDVCCVVCARSNEAKRGPAVRTDHDAKSNNCPTMLRMRRIIMGGIGYD